MTQHQSRAEHWNNLDREWDIVVIGGGITGAGIFHEAARTGYRTLLLEQRDFAWGTSSRSSKMVHGGLRYLKEGDIALTRAAVHEREWLMRHYPGLVEPLGFLLPIYKQDHFDRLAYGVGLTIYDILAQHKDFRYYHAADFAAMVPALTQRDLVGGYMYHDALTDDARLVLRILQEARQLGGHALNYVAAEGLQPSIDGMHIQVRDSETGMTGEVHTHAVINATGAWAGLVDPLLRVNIRPLRGSHLIVPAWRFPVSQAITFMHPRDHRPVFVYPWEGVTVIGTTDVDHDASLQAEPAIQMAEIAYLFEAVDARFPQIDLQSSDIISTFAGVRPVIDSGKTDPSKESRDHIIQRNGRIVTVTGGKLTTFRVVAEQVMKIAHQIVAPTEERVRPVEVPMIEIHHMRDPVQRRIAGRYGADAGQIQLIDSLQPVAATNITPAELRWAARTEQVVHLDDLLLRRVRAGIVCPDGGSALFPIAKVICQQELGWSEEQWQTELLRYQTLVHQSYSMPLSLSFI